MADLRQVHAWLSSKVGDIASAFVPEAKLTLLIRIPSAPDGSQDTLVSDDEIEAVIAALRIRKSEEDAGIGRVFRG